MEVQTELTPGQKAALTRKRPAAANKAVATRRRDEPLRGGRRWGNWKFKRSNLTLIWKTGRFTYEIDLETIRDSAAMLDWIFQFRRYGQATAEDVNNLLEALHTLNPQANLCSTKMSKTINPRAVLADRLAGRAR